MGSELVLPELFRWIKYNLSTNAYDYKIEKKFIGFSILTPSPTVPSLPQNKVFEKLNWSDFISRFCLSQFCLGGEKHHQH